MLLLLSPEVYRHSLTLHNSKLCSFKPSQFEKIMGKKKEQGIKKIKITFAKCVPNFSLWD